MLSTLLFLAVVAGSCVLNVESSEVYKCKNEIIDSIKKSWNGNVPNDILEKAISYRKLLLKASTPGYVLPEYKAYYSFFDKENGNAYTINTLFRIPKDGGKDSKVIIEVIEAGGAYLGKDKKYRWPVYSENGVIGVYTCIDDDKAPEGPPAGMVLVRASGYSQDDYNSALSKLKDVGVKATVEYSFD